MINTLSLLYLPTALGLGALHALEPGHSKTLIAAYLIGTKGTKWDAFLLGVSAATTHSLIVIAIAVSALWLGKEVFTDQVSHWLQIASGVFVILIGAWMLWRRWPRPKPPAHAHHHGAPEPIAITSDIAEGTLGIIATADGERLRFSATHCLPGTLIAVHIAREHGRMEVLELSPDPGHAGRFTSSVAPAEPHEFTAEAILSVPGREERRPFSMHEPAGHHDGHEDHDGLDDDAHARAHAAAMPAYVEQGGRPSSLQVIAFGAAGGMIPCPASITVMLLALSAGQVAFGLLAVMCFSLGLAVTMVGIGMVVVAGFSKLAKTGRFSSLAKHAPLVSAVLVMGTGLAALVMAN
ncbi:MAG: sulfite exporter TauE/SafE family protein [Planctomycetes bacterium]|nr:sulfite exporter TauE/SafE family protein [Planctomycetota bacterium]